mgnify:CR=1 FL=1
MRELEKHNETIKEMLEAGKLHKEIAHLLNVKSNLLSLHIKQYFKIKKIVTYTVKQAKCNVLYDNEIDVVDMYKNGFRSVDIARKYGVEGSDVHNFLYRKSSKL